MPKNTSELGDIVLESGAVLKNAKLAYHTYGTLNADRSNVALICHPLTINSDAADWWSGVVGVGKIADPSKQFVVCFNVLGGCDGSTGPEDVAPEQRGLNFPEISIRDIARSQIAALRSLGIAQLDLLIGASMGGMVALEIALDIPHSVTNLLLIASTAEHSAWRIGVTSAVRKVIESNARTREGAEAGLRLARQLAVSLYRSPQEFEFRFGRQLGEVEERTAKYLVEEYLEHHGEAIVNRFSPYSYITLSGAMERYDAVRGRFGTREELLGSIFGNKLVVGISSDLLYPEREVRAFAKDIAAQYLVLEGDHGHDSFLVDQHELSNLLNQFNPAALASTATL